VGIIMAWLSCGYWSLVGMQLATSLAAFVLTWSISRWRPQLPALRSGTRPLLKFGINWAAGSFLWSLACGADALLIGRFYGPNSVGLYSRAAALLNRPVDQLLSPIATVFIPALSRIQAQPDRYRRVFLQLYEALALISFFIAGLLLALARPLTLVVLGPQWKAAVPIFAAFTITAVFLPLCSAATWLFASQGRGRDSLIAKSVISGVALLSIIAGLPFGPVGVALSYSVSGVAVVLPIMYHLAGRRGFVTTADLWTGFLRHLPVCAVVCGATSLPRALVTDLTPLVQLAICAPIGLFSGVAFIWVYAPARRTMLSLIQALAVFRQSRKFPSPI
jgi:PST family polysaccharide transporter